MRAVATRVGLSLLSALMLFLSVPTWGLWPLMWIALVPQIRTALKAIQPGGWIDIELPER